MSTQIIRHEEGVAATAVARPTGGQVASFVASLDEHWRLANMLVRSGMLPKAMNKPEAAMAVMLKAHEIGIPYMYAFANLHFFDGRLVESAALMVGMAADRCGVTYEVVEWTDERCELLFHRPGWAKPLPSIFTMEDAKRAQLTGKDNWKKYPRAMLLARAQSMGVRAIAPDRFGGMQSVEELRDTGAREGYGAGDHVAEVMQALHSADPDSAGEQIPEAEVVEVGEQPEAAEGSIPAGCEDLHAKYLAALEARGMGDADREAFQKRLRSAGLVQAEEWSGWVKQDYRSALAELDEIPLAAEVG